MIMMMRMLMILVKHSMSLMMLDLRFVDAGSQFLASVSFVLRAWLRACEGRPRSHPSRSSAWPSESHLALPASPARYRL